MRGPSPCPGGGVARPAVVVPHRTRRKSATGTRGARRVGRGSGYRGPLRAHPRGPAPGSRPPPRLAFRLDDLAEPVEPQRQTSVSLECSGTAGRTVRLAELAAERLQAPGKLHGTGERRAMTAVELVGQESEPVGDH